jgi:hypothetical protein
MRESFEEWMEHVDAEVWGIAGVSVHDLSDQPYRDWYESDYSPYEAAECALEDNGFPIHP